MAAATAWAARGHEVFVLDRRYKSEEPECETVDGVRIVRLACRQLRRLSTRRRPSLWLVGTRLERLWFAVCAAAYLRRVEPADVANTYDPITAIAVALCGGRRLAKKIVYTHTSSHLLPTTKARDWPVARWILRQAARRCGWVVLQSEETRRQFVTQGIVDEVQTSVVPPGVDVEFWSDGEDHEAPPSEWAGKDLLVYVGRINKEKGLDTLVEAMVKVVKEYGRENVLLILAGPIEEFDWLGEESPYSRKLKARIAEAGIKKHVRFVGEADADGVRTFYKWSKIVVLPSVTEAFGMVITEAMAAGKAVVATDTHGARMQVKHGVTGLVVPVGDAKAMAAAIVELLEDEATRNRMAEAGYAAAGAFSWPAVAQRYLALFEMINETRRG